MESQQQQRGSTGNRVARSGAIASEHQRDAKERLNHFRFSPTLVLNYEDTQTVNEKSVEGQFEGTSSEFNLQVADAKEQAQA
jgi:hypothetical protein